MDRYDIQKIIGEEYRVSNIEGGEFSYVKEAGGKAALRRKLGYSPEHFKADIRFHSDGVSVVVETKPVYVRGDEKQLSEYMKEEQALFPSNKVVGMLVSLNSGKIKVWKNEVSKENLLKTEKALDTMEHYKSLFVARFQNDREKVLKNTYALNETLHKKDIDEKLRSQFVGTVLLYIRDVLKSEGITEIDDISRAKLRSYWGKLSPGQIRSGIETTLKSLLDGSDNKEKKIKLLQQNVLNEQKVKRLTTDDWCDILDEIVNNIYKYINSDSSEGQDILNLFFIAFNKYTGRLDKNQAFTPDHITNFMCRVTDVDYTKKVFDGACGSGSFLVQAMVMELDNLNKLGLSAARKNELKNVISKEHIFGVEIEEKAFGLATTNMLIHGDGNSNIKNDDLFKCEDFIREADPDIILMNPPYNAKPISIPKEYKKKWHVQEDAEEGVDDDAAEEDTPKKKMDLNWKSNAKEEPTKGMVFLKYISDVIKKMNEERVEKGQARKEVIAAVLLPVAAAIGTSGYISDMKYALLADNTLEAVFTLPNEIFYPGASASACCMVFTLGKPHMKPDGTVNKTFFGYFKEDGHKKKKNLGRIEQFDGDGKSLWKSIEEEWIELYRNKTEKDGLTAMQAVTGGDEWLCEAYMKTDYTKLCKADFQKTVNNFLAYQMMEGIIHES